MSYPIGYGLPGGRSKHKSTKISQQNMLIKLHDFIDKWLFNKINSFKRQNEMMTIEEALNSSDYADRLDSIAHFESHLILRLNMPDRV